MSDPTLAADVSATLQPGFTGTRAPDWLLDARASGLVSVCLYGDNADPERGLAPVCADLRSRTPGLLLAVDEEGGDVTRIHYPSGSPTVGNAVLGRLDDEAVTRAVAAGVGADLVALGIRLDLAPVVDVNSSPDNPVIGVRSLGSDPDAVARHGAAAVAGLRDAGVAACAKHFPGHGDTVVDSHHGLPRVDVPLDVLRDRELVPFAAAVAAGVPAVMTSHVIVSALDPERPATFSPSVVRVLREGLGFDGVLVSDALDMAGASAATGIPEAAVRALLAGVDLLCLGSATTAERWDAVHAAVVDAVTSGRLPRDRVAEAAGRVRDLASAWSDAPTAPVALPGGALPDDLVARAFGGGESVARFVADPAPLAVVQATTGANLAVGSVAWGPAALGATVDEADVPPGAKVAVVGRGIGAGHPAHASAVRLRDDGHRVLLVECGWPRGGADLEVWGGSPAVARALLALLRGEVAG